MVELAMTSMEKLQGLFHLSFVDRIVEGERRLSFSAVLMPECETCKSVNWSHMSHVLVPPPVQIGDETTVV